MLPCLVKLFIFVAFGCGILYIGISPKEDALVENTKNAVSIEVLMNMLEGEVERAYQSMLRSERLYSFEVNYENKTKKAISFWKKQVKSDAKKWHILSQNLFVIKTQLGMIK
jgi:hypothetical protein